MHVNNVAISVDGNVIKKGTENILKYKELTIEMPCMWNVQIRDTSSKRGKWNRLTIIQKILEQHIKKARY
jgi:hypothetical protein